MDWIKEKLPEILRKYRYAILVLILGLVLMAIPGREDGTPAPPAPVETLSREESLEKKLAQLLSQIQGAGRVEVLLTVAVGAETVYQTDDEVTTGTDSGTTRRDTVTVTGKDREQAGLVRQVNPPGYLGAVVVCQGGDTPSVRLAIVEAVSKVTGLGADRISVLKMK